VSARIAVALLVFLPMATARAQWYGDYGYHSSTLEEGVQRGYADVVRSYGMANLLNSQAAGQYEQARKQYIQNQLSATQTYFEMRRYNTEARRAERGTPLSTEQYVRLAREQAPDPLTPTQLDPLTGAINWPAPLRIPAYEQLRKRVEKLFQDRATGYIVYGNLQQAIQDFGAQLKLDLEKFPANDYVTAKRFLESLAWAARGTQG
jgi:type II secretory pathway pseudopilin PulG